ncbi:UNVERIFIED_CONTAM: cytochrome, DM13 and DOMON domain-containing protein [Sesamum angustifolium]|uniref:Cytochrome, DM13 and DOMON domain-containing protein n=1 Tax=Sesamum angustifolium TaxID=2727405 RepID=A0AAW2M7B7_9LAMI
MFENCKVLSDNYRIRWSFREGDDVIDIGLEAAIGIQNYMAFGWANPNASGSLMGVCPDSMYNAVSTIGLVNNTRLVYGHRKDGVSFVRYRRPLQSNDSKYDVKVDPRGNMIVIWAIGLIKPPDSLRPFYLPQNHGGTYGQLRFNISARVNDCLGPLDAQDKEDQDLVIADKKEPLVISTGQALHYPNPPNPSKVLYIKEGSPNSEGREGCASEVFYTGWT